MEDNKTPGLFGLKNTNRDFSVKRDWGKNVFNNAFPAALACYVHSKKLKLVYITLNSDLRTRHDEISTENLFGIDSQSDNLFFAFESLYLPYEALVSSSLPRIDLVTCIENQGTIEKSLRGIEIKLTALPDNSTADFSANEYGPEMVVRPDTIVYLALSIATNYKDNKSKLAEILLPATDRVVEWNNPEEIKENILKIRDAINIVLKNSLSKQKSFLLQPVWKTKGKSLELEDDCLDVYVWSNYGFTRLFIDAIPRNNSLKINRPMRTCVWLAKMLHDFVKEGKINHTKTIRDITFGWQTDKAFAVSGRITRNYLKGEVLLKPRIRKTELKNIILNGGEKMLSPERRFDAAILSNASLFE